MASQTPARVFERQLRQALEILLRTTADGELRGMRYAIDNCGLLVRFGDYQIILVRRSTSARVAQSILSASARREPCKGGPS